MHTRIRRRITIGGTVQGVFFRETVRRIAEGYAVAGFVRNVGIECVVIEAEGDPDEVARFVADVRAHPPAAARVERFSEGSIEPAGATGFRVVRER